MDSHSVDDVVLWHHLPNWDGSWGSFLFAAVDGLC